MTFNMAHLEFNLQTASIFLVFVWIAWRFLKFVFKDPFNNIPGPPSPSLVQGSCLTYFMFAAIYFVFVQEI